MGFVIFLLVGVFKKRSVGQEAKFFKKWLANKELRVDLLKLWNKKES